MPPVINNAADLIRNINAGSSFELTANNEIKKQGFFAKLWQSIGDAIWRSAEAIQERQANLDAAMADMLRGTESLPNLTQQNLLDAADKLPTAFESTLASIQSRLDIAQFPKGTKSIPDHSRQDRGCASGQVRGDVEGQRADFSEGHAEVQRCAQE